MSSREVGTLEPEAAVGTQTARKTWAYPAQEVGKLFAPPEEIHPSLKLRTLLRERFAQRASRPEQSYLHTAGAYDALTASMMTRLGFDALYASGWQLAVAHSMYPDIGIYPSHSMVDLVREHCADAPDSRRHRTDRQGADKATLSTTAA